MADKNKGGRGVDKYTVDNGKMESPWFSGNDDSDGRKAMQRAPKVDSMDCGGATRDSPSGQADGAGAGIAPGGRRS